jgi:hypothetical protein
MSDTETLELSREWRANVRADIQNATLKLDKVLQEIGDMQREFAPVNSHKELAERVRGLENNQSRFMGGIILLNFIGGIALAIIMKLWK